MGHSKFQLWSQSFLQLHFTVDVKYITLNSTFIQSLFSFCNHIPVFEVSYLVLTLSLNMHLQENGQYAVTKNTQSTHLAFVSVPDQISFPDPEMALRHWKNNCTQRTNSVHIEYDSAVTLFANALIWRWWVMDWAETSGCEALLREHC